LSWLCVGFTADRWRCPCICIPGTGL